MEIDINIADVYFTLTSKQIIPIIIFVLFFLYGFFSFIKDLNKILKSKRKY